MAGLPAALLGCDGLANCCLFLIASVRNTWEQAASQAARPTPRRPVDRPIAAHHCRPLVAVLSRPPDDSEGQLNNVSPTFKCFESAGHEGQTLSHGFLAMLEKPLPTFG